MALLNVNFSINCWFVLLTQLFGHQNVSVLDGGLERWIANGFDTTNMMVKKKVIW